MTVIRSLILLLACIAAAPQLSAQQPSEGPDEIISRRYQVSPAFLRPDAISAGGGAVDPFAPADSSSSASSEPAKSVQQTLIDDLGITFPEGTYARVNTANGELEVRHHPAELKAIELFLQALNEPYQQLLLRVEIFQMPIADALHIQRLTDTMDDDTRIWEGVQKLVEVSNSRTTPVASIMVQSRSGQRAKAEDIEELIYPTEIDWSADKKAFVPAAFETRNYGTIFEVDPVIGADDTTIDLNFALEHHTAPPTMHPITLASPDKGIELTTAEMPEFHCKRITTQITMRANTTKLVGAWRPTGKPEFEDAGLMQVAFLRIARQHVRTVVPIE